MCLCKNNKNKKANTTNNYIQLFDTLIWNTKIRG